MKAVRRRLLGINRALEQNKITPDQWTEEFDKILYDGHYEAYELGMKRGGVADPDTEDLEFRARQLKDQESDYLQGYWEGGTYHRGFVEDVRSQDDPRYFDADGSLIPGSLDSRTDLYVGKMRGSANEGFADASEGEASYDWELGDAEHCDDCPQIAAMSPYTWDTLWTTPGAGDCPCLGNCACSLVRTDGMSGFGRVDFEGSEADDFDAEQPDQPSLFARFAAWLSAIDDQLIYGKISPDNTRQFHKDWKVVRKQDPGTVDRDAHQAATSTMNDLADPSDAQKRAGNYRMGHTTIAGLDITIENPSGSRRRPEWSPMSDHYGYIRGTVGFDKDHLDVFVKPGTSADYTGPVFVVNQANSDGAFDEHKCMIGWESEETALAGYLSNYTSGQANRVISVATMSIDEFKSWAFDEAEGTEVGEVAA